MQDKSKILNSLVSIHLVTYLLVKFATFIATLFNAKSDLLWKLQNSNLDDAVS